MVERVQPWRSSCRQVPCAASPDPPQATVGEGREGRGVRGEECGVGSEG